MNDRSTPGNTNQRPSNWVLSQLSDASYGSLQRYFTPFELQVGATLSEAGKPAEYVYFPLSGFVSICVLTESGDSVEVATIGQEGLVNSAPLLDQPQPSHVATVQGDGTALRIRASLLREELRKDPSLFFLVHQATYLEMQQMAQNAVCNRVHSVEQRLARWLLTASDHMQSSKLLLTQEFLAHMLGARRSTVTIAAGDLQRAGLMSYTRGKIQILNREGLEKASCECYRTLRSAFQKVLASGTKKN